MKINRLATTVEEQAQLEYAEALSAKHKAMLDYNIMMGIIEDPSESEDEEDE